MVGCLSHGLRRQRSWSVRGVEIHTVLASSLSALLSVDRTTETFVFFTPGWVTLWSLGLGLW